MKDEPQEDVFSERLDVHLWRRVFRHALPHRRLLVPLIVSAVLIAICDASFALVTRWTVDSVAGKTGLSLWIPASVYGVLAVALSAAACAARLSASASSARRLSATFWKAVSTVVR